MELKPKVTLSDLNSLTPAELIIFEKHLSLGIDHLKKMLSTSELQTLFKLGENKQDPSEQLAHDKIEIIGNLTLLLNSIFTAIFGAWMGLAGFWGVSLGSYQTFVTVVILAIAMGVFMAYHNVKYIKRKARLAINRQQLNGLETKTLNKIYEKRQDEARQIIEDLNHLLAYIAEETSFAENCHTYPKIEVNKEVDAWLVEFDGIIEELTAEYRPLRDDFGADLELMQAEIKTNLTSCFQDEAFEVIQDSNSEDQKAIVFGKLLTSLPKDKPGDQSWLKSNWREMLISFIPTVIGGFSSLFVYMGGGPNIARAFEHERLLAILSDPTNKMIEFVLSLFMTGFLAFFFLHVNRQLIKRNRELEKKQKSITQMEGQLTIIDARLHKLKEAKSHMSRLADIIKAMRINKHSYNDARIKLVSH